MKYTETEKAEALETMSKMLKPGDTVYTVLRHVSKSGMSREIGLVVPVPSDKKGNGAPMDFWHPNYSAAVLLGESRSKDRDGIKVSGCGMDMGFHLVYSLGRVMFPNGFECTGEGCKSNDHSNGDRNYQPHHHNDGGYAFNHRWL